VTNPSAPSRGGVGGAVQRVALRSRGSRPPQFDAPDKPPVVGDLDLKFETMELSAERGLTMFVYTAEAGTKSAEALNLLASWAATPGQPETAPTADGA
jgi:hypothetical protein